MKDLKNKLVSKEFIQGSWDLEFHKIRLIKYFVRL